MRARLLAPVAAIVLLLAGCTGGHTSPGVPEPAQETGASGGAGGGPSASGGQSEAPGITVRAEGSTWLVRGTGFTGGNQYLVQCTGGTTVGADALDACDMSTSEQVVADERGRITATRQARTFVNVGSVSEVDCTGDPCALAVADLSDRVLAAAAAPLPDGAEPLEAPTLTLSEQTFRSQAGRVTVTGKGFVPGAAVRIVQCAAASGGGVDGDNCLYDDGERVIANSAGSLVTTLPVEREIQLVGGGTVDCAEAGACVIANAWTGGGRIALVELLWE